MFVLLVELVKGSSFLGSLGQSSSRNLVAREEHRLNDVSDLLEIVTSFALLLENRAVAQLEAPEKETWPILAERATLGQ